VSCLTDDTYRRAYCCTLPHPALREEDEDQHTDGIAHVGAVAKCREGAAAVSSRASASGQARIRPRSITGVPAGSVEEGSRRGTGSSLPRSPPVAGK
jgi:hypothetical protein